MRFHEVRQFDVPGISLTEQAVPGTDPVTGRPLGVAKPSIWDTISGVFKDKDTKKPQNPEKPEPSGIPALNPLKKMISTQDFKGWQHQGVDLRATVGTPIYAPEDGVVKLLKGFRAGLYIELTTATGLHRFMHLSTYSVKDGEKITAGTELGLTGNTGVSTGPHLHWEYWIDGKAIDPITSLKEGTLANIGGNIWKKITGAAEKELPDTVTLTRRPSDVTPTPTRDIEKTPRPTPVYGTQSRPTPVIGEIPSKTMQTTSPFRNMIANVESAGVRLIPLPGGDQIVQIAGRPIVVVDVGGGRTIPFYVSTGGGGKKGVPTGKWYPFFGIRPNGFFNKGWDEAQINTYYGNQTLAHIAQVLDSKFGNVIPHTDRMPEGQAARGHINAGLKPFSYRDSDPFSKAEFEAYQKYINGIVNSI